MLNFLLGLLIGLGLLWWERSRSNARVESLAQRLSPDISEYPFSSTSQLALAIAQQQRVQQEHAQQLATYRQVLQLAPVGYLQVDDENRLLWCNPQAQGLLGIASEEASPDKPRLLLELVRSYELDELIERTRDMESLCRNEWSFNPVSVDPTHLSEQEGYGLRGYGIPLPDRQIGIFLENRQESLQLAQRHDRWASDLAHELKTPLTSIRLVAETLQSRLDPPLQNWIDRLINETVRLSTLVQDLLELNRSGRSLAASLQFQPLDLAELIQSVWNSLEPLAGKKQLYLRYTGPDRLLMEADLPRIHRLLVNLLDNGIKYSSPQQPIWVNVSLEPSNSEKLNGPNCQINDDFLSSAGFADRHQTARLSSSAAECEQQVCLDVIDYGPGFSEKALPHVFERFYRADFARARPALAETPSPKSLPSAASGPSSDWQTRGSGLGLAIVQQIVEVHQGTVQANNHPETKGAWLQVRLPWRPVPDSGKNAV